MTRDTAALFLYLCDNLSNFVTHHGHRSQFFVLSSNIARRVATLLKAREKYVRLGANNVSSGAHFEPRLNEDSVRSCASVLSGVHQDE